MRQVTHALLTRPPLRYSGASSSVSPFDLHVLGAPPAFVSQDQTLNPFGITSQGLPCAVIFSSLNSHCRTFLVELNRVDLFLFAISLHCLIFKIPSLPFSERLDYFITSRPLCQELFFRFFRLPASPFVPSGQLCYYNPYPPFLSIPFFHFFFTNQNFFSKADKNGRQNPIRRPF